MKTIFLFDSLFDTIGRTLMQDFPLQILITKKVTQLSGFFRCLEIVEARNDKLNVFTSRLYENRIFL